jgi:hypothetical protein
MHRRNVVISGRKPQVAAGVPRGASVIKPPSKPAGKGLVQLGGLRKQNAQTPEVLPDDEVDLFKLFCKEFVWGGMQGAFEMGADFFRNHRFRR